MIELEESQLACIKGILAREAPKCEVRAFGSRVNGTARQFSDLDLVLVCREKLYWRRLEALRNAFSESDLPFMIDVLDWQAISESFRERIERQYEVIQTPE